MLLLPEPFGYGQGVHISLRTPFDTLDEERLVRVLRQYSCHEPAIPKILSCLRHSGRYDCVVRQNWFYAQHYALGAFLTEIGVNLFVLHR